MPGPTGPTGPHHHALPASLNVPLPTTLTHCLQEHTQRAIAEQYKRELLGQIQAAQEARRHGRQAAVQEGARLR
jgi:hypothetical protein